MKHIAKRFVIDTVNTLFFIMPGVFASEPIKSLLLIYKENDISQDIRIIFLPFYMEYQEVSSDVF